MMKRAILFLFVPLFASADPGAATKFLMNEPASLFDIILIRMNADLNSRQDAIAAIYSKTAELSETPITIVAVSYDFESDIISLGAVFLASAEPFELAEEGCRSIIDLMVQVSPSLYARFLTHYGYQATNRPAGTTEAIQKRIELDCWVGALDESAYLKVSRPLLKAEYSVMRNETAND